MSTPAETPQGETGKDVAETWTQPAEAKEENPKREWMRVFLRELRQHGSASEAARICCKSLPYVYRCRKSSRSFAKRWADALVTARRRKVDAAESRLKHLAVDGYDEPVFQGGELVGHKRKYSVEALKTLLGAEHPRKYARKASGNHATSIAITIDARQASLRDPIAMQLACELDERLALMQASDQATIDVTPQACTQPNRNRGDINTSESGGA